MLFRHEAEVSTHLQDRGPIDGLTALGHPADEGIVTDHVDSPRNSSRALVSEDDRLTGKETRWHAASGGDAARNICRGIRQCERLQLAPQRDTLLQLSKMGFLEPRG